jgi:hypothetical protein
MKKESHVDVFSQPKHGVANREPVFDGVYNKNVFY